MEQCTNGPKRSNLYFQPLAGGVGNIGTIYMIRFRLNNLCHKRTILALKHNLGSQSNVLVSQTICWRQHFVWRQNFIHLLAPKKCLAPKFVLAPKTLLAPKMFLAPTVVNVHHHHHRHHHHHHHQGDAWASKFQTSQTTLRGEKHFQDGKCSWCHH